VSQIDGGINGNFDYTDPLIESFMDHGGLTPTCAIAETSPAINAGTDDGAPEFDQRGFSRHAATDIGSFEYQSISGISIENENHNIDIFPNPTTDFVNVRFNHNGAGDIQIKVYDINGNRKVTSFAEIDNYKMQVDVSWFSAGIYYLKLFSGERFLGTTRFVKF